jgi:2-desacetyl-2-hydroxyethyl bacteriochlorophyllide A dehydrogenase
MASNPTVVFLEPDQVIIEERRIPEPAEGEALVENLYTLISPGTELTLLRGQFPEGSVWQQLARYPIVPGYSSVARVERVGSGVSGQWLGSTVVCRAGHCRFSSVPVESLTAIPKGIVAEQACFHTLALIALNGIRRADLRLGESVVIFGMGPVGHLAALFCGLAGACPIIVVDNSQYRLELLPEDRLLKRINPNRENLQALVEVNTEGRMADVVIEASGDGDLIPIELSVLREQGRFVILSSPRRKTEFDFHDLCCRPSISIIGAHNHSHPPVETLQNPWSKARHLQLLFILLTGGRLDLTHMITHRIPFSQTPEIYRRLLAGEIEHLGILIRWRE